jgi:hypothetical protein
LQSDDDAFKVMKRQVDVLGFHQVTSFGSSFRNTLRTGEIDQMEL